MVKSKKSKKNIDEHVTTWMGSMQSIFIHSILFIVFLTLPFYTTIGYDSALLILTTIVSLEAIYLALFIQISINRQTKVVEEISDDIEEVHEHVEEINESVDEIEKDVDELQEDIEDITEEMEEDEKEEEHEEVQENKRKEEQKLRLEKIEQTLEVLLKEIHNLKK
jgi:uncharacterized membrane protein